MYETLSAQLARALTRETILRLSYRCRQYLYLAFAKHLKVTG